MRNSVFNFLRKEVLSIDMGAYNTKFVTGKSYGDDIIIKRMFLERTPKELYKDGQVLDNNMMMKFIKKVIEERNLKCKYMALTFSSSELITKDVSIPSSNVEDLRQMLEFEIQQCFPIDTSQYNIQYKLTEDIVEKGIKKSKFNVVALPKDISDKYLELCNLLGLKPYILDIHSNCISKILDVNREFNGEDKIKNRTIAVLDIGYDYTEVVLIEEGKFKFSRLISSAGKDIDIFIANTFNLTIKEAEKKKLTMNNMDNSSLDSMIREITASSLNGIMLEIDKIFKFYLSRTTGNSIDAIYICGGSSRIKGIDKIIEKYFNIPTNILKNVSNIKIYENKSLKKSLPNNEDEDVSLYINAIGALVRR